MTAFDHQTLAVRALEARKNAYAPYSQYPVGAALLAADGSIYTGALVENACIAANIDAPHSAFLRAVSEGASGFIAIAIASRDGDAPCGGCREVIAEFAPDIRILLVTESGAIAEHSLTDLPPRAPGSHPA